jgi:HlyD family secretion protein
MATKLLPLPLNLWPTWLKLPLKSRWLIGSLLLMGLASGSLVALRSVSSPNSSQQMLTAAVERQSLPVTITANGTVNAERSINLSPKSAGVIKTLLVKEGDRVRQGQVIAVMDDSNLQGQLAQMRGQLGQQEANLQRLIAGNRPEDIAKAEAQLAEAEANLQQLRAGNRPQEIAQVSARLMQAQATLQQREADVQRYQQLYDTGAIARQNLEQKITDRDVAQQQVMEADQSLALQNAGTRPEQIAQAQARVDQQAQTVAALRAGNRVEDIAQARAQVEAAQGALQTVAAQLNDTKVVAPFDGIVMKKYADVGAFVSPSMAGGSSASASSSSILTLASTRHDVSVNLSESQISKIKPGQAVTLKVDALPDVEVTGKVDRIAPQAAVTQNVTSFEVQVAITSSTANLVKTGMNVEAKFAVGNLANALLVPNAAVVRQAQGEGVYVLNSDRKPQFQAIQTGITTSGKTEVKTGLQGNEQVLVSPPAPTKSSGIGFPPRQE